MLEMKQKPRRDAYKVLKGLALTSAPSRVSLVAAQVDNILSWKEGLGCLPGPNPMSGLQAFIYKLVTNAELKLFSI